MSSPRHKQPLLLRKKDSRKKQRPPLRQLNFWLSKKRRRKMPKPRENRNNLNKKLPN
jgi:hypothetical protein